MDHRFVGLGALGFKSRVERRYSRAGLLGPRNWHRAAEIGASFDGWKRYSRPPMLGWPLRVLHS